MGLLTLSEEIYIDMEVYSGNPDLGVGMKDGDGPPIRAIAVVD